MQLLCAATALPVAKCREVTIDEHLVKNAVHHDVCSIMAFARVVQSYSQKLVENCWHHSEKSLESNHVTCHKFV